MFHPSVTIKQGYLWKRKWDKIKVVNAFTFKKRYFWLKYDTISYAKKPTDNVDHYFLISVNYCQICIAYTLYNRAFNCFQVRNNIPISQVCAVERVDKQAFSKSNMGQIITRNPYGQIDILYFQAKVSWSHCIFVFYYCEPLEILTCIFL